MQVETPRYLGSIDTNYKIYHTYVYRGTLIVSEIPIDKLDRSVLETICDTVKREDPERIIIEKRRIDRGFEDLAVVTVRKPMMMLDDEGRPVLLKMVIAEYIYDGSIIATNIFVCPVCGTEMKEAMTQPYGAACYKHIYACPRCGYKAVFHTCIDLE